jgi:acetoin utilization protein AcuB
MRVSRFMQRNVITIPSSTLANDAQKLMQQNDIRRLPVVDDGKLVGIITRSRLRDAAPSAATSLSVWEMNYLISKITVKELMEKSLLTTSPQATIEEAAATMAEHRIGAMPVLEGGKLVGIITATDLFRLLIDVLGVRQPGARIQIEEPYADRPFGSVTDIFAEHKVKILSVFTFTDPQTHRQDMVIRAATEDAGFIAQVMRDKGFTVVEGDAV